MSQNPQPTAVYYYIPSLWYDCLSQVEFKPGGPASPSDLANKKNRKRKAGRANQTPTPSPLPSLFSSS